jgi:hypothetical protein
MSFRRRLHGICLLLAAIACASVKAEDGRVIAEVRGGSIVYSDIRCPNRIREASPEQCQQREQASLRRLLAGHVVECAADVGRITLTKEDEQQIELQVADERAGVLQIIDRHRVVLRGVLRVQEGEQLDDVAADLARTGVKAEDLETQLRYLDDADATRKALAKDYVASAAAATRAVMRQTLLLDKLREHVAALAAAAGRTTEDEENALIQSAIQNCGIRIIDGRYQAPDLKGVLKRHVQQTQIRQ